MMRDMRTRFESVWFGGARALRMAFQEWDFKILMVSRTVGRSRSQV
jgi:hypothetical protein